MSITVTQTIKAEQLDEALKRIARGGMHAEIIQKDGNVSGITLRDANSRESIRFEPTYGNMTVSATVPEERISFEICFDPDSMVGKRIIAAGGQLKHYTSGEDNVKNVISYARDMVEKIAPEDSVGIQPFAIFKRVGFESASGFVPKSICRIDNEGSEGVKRAWSDRKKVYEAAAIQDDDGAPF